MAVALSAVEVFDDFRSKVKSAAAIEAGTTLMREFLVRLPLRQLVPDINDFGLELMTRLISHLPLSPLTGVDDEWVKRAGGQQNRRCPRVQKFGGVAVDTIDPNAATISFPYYPPTLRE